jgi:hypothetical protein
MINNRSVFNFFLIFLVSVSFGAQNTSRVDRRITASPINNGDVIIDGRLDEPIWESAHYESGFLQRNPNDGAPASQKTEFAVTYDSDYLYVGVKAHDTHPELIEAILTRRDESSPADWVYISIDSYHDHRTAFEFGLNAAGVKQDLRRFDDTNADFDWDAVWEGAVQITPAGWTIEFAIPFRELRFNTAESLLWGFNIYRELPRNDQELSIWNHWSHEESGFVSNYGELNGLQNVQAKLPFYLSPYALAETGFMDDELSYPDQYESFTNLGADFKKSFRQGLTLTGTVNPDFGQVEADPAEFNLTEFETYFREKRPFFMEGGNILNFNLGFGDGDNSQNTLFYSRRIGRGPQGGTAHTRDDAIAVDRPDQTSIIAAGKLTGKLENGLAIGIMAASTAEEKASVEYADGSSSSNTIEPATTYIVTRLQKDFRAGQTTVGGIVTSTMRDLDGSGMDWLRARALTGGLDFNHRFAERKYEIQSALAFSHVEGSQQSILLTQLHPSRYFQRPDAPHLSLDSTRTALDGFAGKLIAGLSSGKINAYAGVLATSPGFEVNDLGFMRSVDNINQFIWVGYRHWEPGSMFLNYGINFNQWANWTFGGEMKNVGGNVNGNGTLSNNWSVGGGVNISRSGIVPYHLRGGPSIQGPDNMTTWLNIGTDSRKDLSAYLSTFYSYNVDDVHSWNISPSLNWRPQKNVFLTLGTDFNLLDDSWAWITSMEDSVARPHYVFSGLDLSQTSLTFRADIILTTNLSFQYYTQAFLTGGDYHDYIEVNDHGARKFDERFSSLPDHLLSFDSYGALTGVDLDQDGIVDYWPVSRVDSDFNYRELTSNMVLRWEYSAGSVLYLVWSRGGAGADPFWNKDYREDLGALIDLNSNNVFLLKVTKLFNI